MGWDLDVEWSGRPVRNRVGKVAIVAGFTVVALLLGVLGALLAVAGAAFAGLLLLVALPLALALHLVLRWTGRCGFAERTDTGRLDVILDRRGFDRLRG